MDGRTPTAQLRTCEQGTVTEVRGAACNVRGFPLAAPYGPVAGGEYALAGPTSTHK